MQCKKCLYIWKTRSNLMYVSCPNCGAKNKIFRKYIPLKTKRELYKRAKNKCEDCGSKEKLEVHHIIPVQKRQNHKLENLKLLCHECHMKIPKRRREIK
jgi:5-methylcytosine-specific restriction endonuclease McrA